MIGEYVEERNGGYYISATRVSLDSVVYSFHRGSSPDAIQAEYPVLNLSQVYGAIAFYLDHRSAIDQHLEEKQQEFQSSAIPLHEANPELWAKLERARQAIGDKKP
jgi:uncharacterized protein (DUF433 family)